MTEIQPCSGVSIPSHHSKGSKWSVNRGGANVHVFKGGGGGGGRSWLRFYFKNLRDIWGYFRGFWRDFYQKNWEFPERVLEHFSGLLWLGLNLTPPESCVI